MAAIPGKGVSKAMFVLWIDLTNWLVSIGALTASDSLTTSLTTAATERDAH